MEEVRIPYALTKGLECECHTHASLSYLQVVAFPNVYELFGKNASARVRDIERNLDAWAKSQAHNTGADADALKVVFEVVAKTIVEDHGRLILSCHQLR